jgi:hypothetical protein
LDLDHRERTSTRCRMQMTFHVEASLCCCHPEGDGCTLWLPVGVVTPLGPQLLYDEPANIPVKSQWCILPP